MGRRPTRSWPAWRCSRRKWVVKGLGWEGTRSLVGCTLTLANLDSLIRLVVGKSLHNDKDAQPVSDGQEVSVMTLLIETVPVPLEVDAGGVVRVGGTRVTLDTVVAAFNEGATAEEIVHQYPSLHLADVYAVIGYYLRRRPEVEVYLHQRQQQAEDTRKQNESRFDPHGVRDRLLARRRA